MIKEVMLGDFFAKKGTNVNPSKHQDEEFDLYSIPAYDVGSAKRLKGKDIGSSKKLLQSNDVVLSRIIPHIRRCWIIPKNEEIRKIGSGEWIIFRSNEIDASYLRHYLMSDYFNKMFMSTVKGVGGSLLRADPKQVAKFKIPLPKLETQKKIAAILDEADKVRQLNKQLIKKYDALTQSLFLDMFGDPVTNPKGWEKVKFNTVCSFKKTSIKPEEIISGTYYIGLESIEKGTGKISEKVAVSSNELKSNKFYFDENFILYGKLRPYLNKVGNPDFQGICSTDIIPIKPISGKSNKQFVTSIMRSSSFVSWANERCSGANLPRISPKEVEKYLIINPPIEFQNQFAERVQIIENQKQQVQEALQKSEDLFNSLLQKAFKGELVKA